MDQFGISNIIPKNIAWIIEKHRNNNKIIITLFCAQYTAKTGWVASLLLRVHVKREGRVIENKKKLGIIPEIQSKDVRKEDLSLHMRRPIRLSRNSPKGDAHPTQTVQNAMGKDTLANFINQN